MNTDRIEKKVILRAPLSKVGRALANAEEFGAWFGLAFTGGFVPGTSIDARVTTPGYEHVTLSITIERMDPERHFSYRWHPNAVEPDRDYAQEPTTLVEFQLDEVAGGTQLTVVESGFEGIPAARRAVAFRMNSAGWAEQMTNIERYVAA